MARIQWLEAVQLNRVVRSVEVSSKGKSAGAEAAPMFLALGGGCIFSRYLVGLCKLGRVSYLWTMPDAEATSMVLEMLTVL